MAESTLRPFEEEFYVGYQPRAPLGIAARVRRAVLVLLVAAATCAVVATTFQNAPAPSAWPSQPVTVRGYVVADPYPRLIVPSEDASAAPRTVLLSAVGKFGLLPASEYCGASVAAAENAANPEAAEQRAALREANMHYIELRGSLMHRLSGGVLREMLEVESSGLEVRRSRDDLRGSDQSRLGFTLPVSEDLGEVTLKGEIADPKCFFGAMKPGSGLTHKACAIRCISGGITPVFIAHDAKAQWACYALTDLRGMPCNLAVAHLAGDPITVRGRLTRKGDALFLAVDPASLR